MFFSRHSQKKIHHLAFSFLFFALFSFCLLLLILVLHSRLLQYQTSQHSYIYEPYIFSLALRRYLVWKSCIVHPFQGRMHLRLFVSVSLLMSCITLNYFLMWLYTICSILVHTVFYLLFISYMPFGYFISAFQPLS